MRHFYLFIILLSYIYSCTSYESKKTLSRDLIPKTSSLTLSISNFDAFKTDSKNNTIFNAFLDKKLDSVIGAIEIIDPKSEIFVSFDSLTPKYNFSIFTTLGDTIPKLNSRLHYDIVDSVFVVSTSQEIIDNLELNKNSSETPQQSLNESTSFSIQLNNQNIIDSLGNLLFDNDVQNFSKELLLDFEILSKEIHFNGITPISDSITNVTDIFKHTIPQENRIANITPKEIDGFLSFTFEDFATIHKNLLSRQNTKLDSISISPVFETINEVGHVYLNNKNAIVLNSIDVQTTKDALIEFQEETSSFRNIPIFKFDNTNIFKNTLQPFISSISVSKYIALDDFFVFSDSETFLKQIISSYQNNSVLSQSENYKDLKTNLSDESSLLIFTNSKKLQQIFSTLFQNDFDDALFKSYDFNAFQFTIDDRFMHVNGIIKKEVSKSTAIGVSETFNINLDATILMPPHFVINHRTRDKEIVVQDVNNNLYLISNSGNILWKKQVNGNVLGSIQQVDLYKNGRLQLTFATPSRIYVIDRNGNDVSPFPLRFKDPITKPLSIFDYDNNKNYRFLVTQNNSLLMYDSKGKRVNGFRYQSTNKILTQPKHFGISGKDYIVFGVDDKMKIIDRQGRDRIQVNESIDFSGNPIFRFNDKFTTTSNSGQLIQVNLKGNVSKQVLNLETDHSIETTNKTLVTLTENILTIKQKTVELDFGNYTAPKIFYLNDKIYVSTTDLQTQKVYLYDSKGRLISNFPIYGNSEIDLDNIDRDSNLEFVTQGDNNSIILYEKN